jgi:hypothetical protein
MTVCHSIKIFYAQHCFAILLSTDWPVSYTTVRRYVTFGVSIPKERNLVYKIEEVHALKANGKWKRYSSIHF